MTRLATAFTRAREEQRAALVIYLCAGDPDLETTERLILAAAEAGADIIEVGMPFSDPTADGPVIQRASERALRAGTTLPAVFDLVRRVRERSDVGIVLFGYYNPILALGEAKTAELAKRAGIDGFLVVDLPPEEAGSLLKALAVEALDFVPLIAPTTPESRVDLIAATAGSFLYYVSLTGVTGARADLEAAGARARELRARTKLPVAVGFGVKTTEDAHTLARHADGVVVGSAIVSVIEQAGGKDQAVARVRELVRSLRQACGR
jgi:tryptophan synthase alpha chain